MTLDTGFFVPYRYFHCDIAFFVLGSACRPYTITGNFGNWKLVTFLFDDFSSNFFYKVRSVIRNGFQFFYRICGSCRESNLLNPFKGLIDGGDVHVNNCLTLFAVSLFDGFFNGFDGHLVIDYLADLEESSLHYGIDTCTQANLLCDTNSIDYKEFRFFIDKLFLETARKLVPDSVFIIRCFKKEHPAFFQIMKHVVFLHEREVVTCDEICRSDQVRFADKVLSETQMGSGDCTCFSGIVVEKSLCVVIGILGYDFYAVFIVSNCTIRTQTIEKSADAVIGIDEEAFVKIKRTAGYIIVDTDYKNDS